MIVLSDLQKRFGPKVLFEGVTVELTPGQRYGLVGANGSGKSTLLKILMGDEHADGGTVTFGRDVRIGFLRQDQFLADSERIVDVAMQGDRAVYEALRELHESGEGADHERVARLTELVERDDGYGLEARAREILVGVGIPAEKLDEPLGTLSGGFKLRVLLSQVLAGRPDVLLLDEPTNHLDILSIRWLEKFLGGYAGCAVVISHDRRFLDAVTTRTLDVDYETITDYPGNYTRFLAEKELRRGQREAEAARAEKIIAEKRAFVERFKAKATKARQAQSRAKQIEKIEVVEVKATSRRAPLFRFQQERQTGKDVLTVEGIAKSYGELEVLSGVNFSIRRGERVALIGQNGIGKSTLLKIVTDHLSPNSGTSTWGTNVKVGYFAQDHHDLLSDPKQTPLDYVWAAAPSEATSTIRGELGRMLVSGSEVEKKITTLSGGEAARVVFARIAIEKPNVLVLDEPTNHLDLESIEALTEALEKYEGTLIFVSHDRWFVSRIATRIIELRRDGMTDYPGTFTEYLAKDGTDHLDAATLADAQKREKTDANRAARGAASGPSREPSEAQLADKRAASSAKKSLSPYDHEERRRRSNRLKALPKKRDEALARIDALETDKSRLQARYTEPDFFTKTPAAEQTALREQEATLDRAITDAMLEWETLEAEIAELSQDAAS